MPHVQTIDKHLSIQTLVIQRQGRQDELQKLIFEEWSPNKYNI